MKRLVPAAQQLVAQVATGEKKGTAKVVGEPDGFGRYRSVSFDAATSRWLVPALELISDPRIAKVIYTGKRSATIIFVGDTRADHRNPFPIESVGAILRGEDQ